MIHQRDDLVDLGHAVRLLHDLTREAVDGMTAEMSRQNLVWSVMAFAALNDSDKANERFSILNPINRTSTRAGVDRCEVEPYVAAADVHAESPPSGRMDVAHGLGGLDVLRGDREVPRMPASRRGAPPRP